MYELKLNYLHIGDAALISISTHVAYTSLGKHTMMMDGILKIIWVVLSPIISIARASH